MDFTLLRYILVGICCLPVLTEFVFVCFPDGRVVISKSLGIHKLELTPSQEKFLHWHKLVWFGGIANLFILFILRHVLHVI